MDSGIQWCHSCTTQNMGSLQMTRVVYRTFASFCAITGEILNNLRICWSLQIDRYQLGCRVVFKLSSMILWWTQLSFGLCARVYNLTCHWTFLTGWVKLCSQSGNLTRFEPSYSASFSRSASRLSATTFTWHIASSQKNFCDALMHIEYHHTTLFPS